MLCRFVRRPSNEHWQAIDMVLRYLRKGTMNLGLHYQRFFVVVLERYTDADWNTLLDDSKKDHWIYIYIPLDEMFLANIRNIIY